jgi:nucleoside 2-deoxyribosyltransferase
MPSDRSVKKIYFAAPLFTQAEREWNRRIAALLTEAGYHVLLPQALAQELITPGQPIPGQKLFDEAIGRIDEADVVIAVLDGADVDSGTSFECGYAWARHKPLLGIRSDLRLGGDDFDRAVNLMLSFACDRFVRCTYEDIAMGMDALAQRLLAELRELLQP